jgi:two-component system sensor histidine kinase PilS (NtrC family)
MLSDVPALSDEQRKLLQIVTRESDRLNNIITDFLAYSRGKQYRFERVNLVPLLQDTLTLLQNRLTAENSGTRLRQTLPTSEAWVLADGDKLKQVFWNFSENALRAMKDRGGILTAALVERGPDWELSFTDTGPGISPQQTEKIFEPFQSNFEGGTGLGLAIVYQIVQAHEGKVWARSEVGKGTSFVVRLRRMEAGIAATPSPTQLTGAVAAAGGGTRG